MTDSNSLLRIPAQIITAIQEWFLLQQCRIKIIALTVRFILQTLRYINQPIQQTKFTDGGIV